MLQPQPVRDDYENIRANWQTEKRWPDFEKGWRRTLHDGLVADTSLPEKHVSLKTDALSEASSFKKGAPTGIEITFRPDPSIWDGRFVNNGWLQECAKPISKLT